MDANFEKFFNSSLLHIKVQEKSPNFKELVQKL